MFNKIGDKIKVAAVLIFCVMATPSFIYGIRLLANGYNSTYTGIGCLLIIIGPIVAWISAVVLYGFGELIESSRETAETSKKILKKLDADTNSTQFNISEANEKPTIFKAAETVTKEACTQPNQTASAPESTTAEINTPPAAEEPKSLVEGVPFMAEPKDFEMNKSWHTGVEKLSDEKLLKRYLSTYEYSDVYRYICYLEIVKRSKQTQ